MRGEHPFQLGGETKWAGSSPHARGALIQVGSSSTRTGVIPACAGSTERGGRAMRARRGHPRMRGEHWRGIIAALLVRGVIPACAGSTVRNGGAGFLNRGHPRMRGEHICFTPGNSASRGSSPHARGARLSPGRLRRSFGVIPACAGSTFVRLTHVIRPRGHPRMRGEHTTSKNLIIPEVGSSPHARGAPYKSLNKSLA